MESLTRRLEMHHPPSSTPASGGLVTESCTHDFIYNYVIILCELPQVHLHGRRFRFGTERRWGEVLLVPQLLNLDEYIARTHRLSLPWRMIV
jgi:hypothetical protein